MIVRLSPSAISGAIDAPPSKSSMQRACAVALISGGTTIIENAGNSNDEQAAKKIIETLGASVNTIKNQVIVNSPSGIFRTDDPKKHLIVSCGESGLSLRMFVPVAALFNHDISFTGEGSILTRPINFFDEVLPKLNVYVHSANGRLPILVRGPLQPKPVTIDGSLSSQFLTGLIIAFAKACTAPVTIRVKDLKSKPYISLTLQVLHHFGYKIDNENFEHFTIHPRAKSSEVISKKYKVEGDWSNAAFLLVAGVISGVVKLSGMDMNSTQGDKNIIQALEAAGANMHVGANVISVKKSKLSAFKFDATHCPDLFPPLVALASYCQGITTISGVKRLRFKESNRGVTLQKEFAKMNVRIDINEDIMTIWGGNIVKGNTVSSNNDHRIAMATAVAGLQAKGDTIVSAAEAVNKSYPGFYDDLQKLNAKVHLS